MGTQMRIDRNMLNWGIFFIFVGLIPLGVQQGIVGPGIGLASWWRLWPLFIVAFGLMIVFSRTRLWFIGGTLFAACLGLVVGGVLSAAPGWDGCRPAGASAFETRTGSLSSGASVDLEISCGSLNVTTDSESGWTAKWSSNGGTPSISSDSRSFSVRSGSGAGWWFDGQAGDWQISLPRDRSVTFGTTVDGGSATVALAGLSVPSGSVTVNAGSLHLDLTGANTGSMSVSVNAGSAAVTLDPGSDVNLSASTNLGSLDVCTSPDLGVEIQLRDSLGGNNLGTRGFTRNGNVWTSPGAQSKVHHARLDVSTNLGSLNVDPAGGCR